ncbi:putative F-box/kelch-repeat protein [Cardamine amara subsp. amara]|uniref:F-box/kelch-repeat protein n=1 Tax=Cardamine amara subsp. amara TaxID=228776 RepID=A0ABD1BS96_CARAN
MSMSSSVDEEKPPKKLKLSSLPDEVVLSCVARVSRWDHASLFLASKSYRSLMDSPDLYDFRPLMGCTENFNYLCLRIPPDPNPRWLAFSPKDGNRRRLVPIRSHFYQPPEDSTVVAHGHGIYVIGGSINRSRSSSVLFLDCRSHKWSTLPAMRVARASAAAGVLDGKINVFGGCEDPNSDKWVEIFDPKTQTWDVLPVPLGPDEERASYNMMLDSVVVEDKAMWVEVHSTYG